MISNDDYNIVINGLRKQHELVRAQAQEYFTELGRLDDVIQAERLTYGRLVEEDMKLRIQLSAALVLLDKKQMKEYSAKVGLTK